MLSPLSEPFSLPGVRSHKAAHNPTPRNVYIPPSIWENLDAWVPAPFSGSQEGWDPKCLDLEGSAIFDSLGEEGGRKYMCVGGEWGC